MKFYLRAIAVGAVVVGAMGFGPGNDPSKTIEYANQELSVAKSRQDRIDAQARVFAKAKETVEGVDPAKLDPKDGYKWAQVFQMAKMPAEATIAAERFLASPQSEDRFSAQALALNLYIAQKQALKATELLKQVQPSTPDETLKLASVSARLVLEVADQATKFQILDAAQKFVKFDGITDPKQKGQEESALSMLVTARLQLYSTDKNKNELVNTIDDAIKLVQSDPKFVTHFKTLRNQYTLVGSVATELTNERAYGTFTGLNQWKGKVVVIDFFAHWCPPCKASFPDMEKLYADFHAKGLEIVGSTTYYGYYEKEKGLTKDQEFAKMEEFIKQYNIPWPIQFSDRSNFENYGVTGIPQVVVIDKTGKIHDLHIGYSAQTFPEFRQAVEKLLSE